LLLNGPESFYAGRQLHSRRSAGARRLLCLRQASNSAGIANAGGAGRLIAEWIVEGEAPFDVFDIDIRRFAPFHANRAATSPIESSNRWVCNSAMRWPREELTTVRPLRRSPLYDRLKAKGAVFGTN
jgi:4-methylaminobutanoate oxidase (formaldehyde-forming)